MEDKAKIEKKLDKLNELLNSDESFRKKFFEIFDMKEKISFQIIEDPRGEKGCHCYPYLCGVGCFYGPAVPKPGEVVG